MTNDIVTATDGADDRELARISRVHNHLKTWAVHDARVCVYLAVLPQSYQYIGVFCCTFDADGDECPWLDTCDTDAYVGRVARPLYAQAEASGFDDAVIYGLLEELHAKEQPAPEEPDRTLTAPERRAESDRYMMATKAMHKLGDISRDEPDLAIIYGEDGEDYIGQWLTGFGYINVRFPKATTRDLTAEEIAHYRTKAVATPQGLQQIFAAEPTTEEPDRTLTAPERRAESDYIAPFGVVEEPDGADDMMADLDDEQKATAKTDCACGHWRIYHGDVLDGATWHVGVGRCYECGGCDAFVPAAGADDPNDEITGGAK